MGKSLGLYIHIPFCHSKCDYCDFYSLAGTDARMKAYQKALLRHLRETAPRTLNYTVDTVYFGGGPPSYYGEQRLRPLLQTIQKFFSLSQKPEITVEANPDSLDEKTLDRLYRDGFNRLSIGMQSADDRQLRALGRPHTFAQTQTAFKAARTAGFDNISLDLMLGLPGQTMEDWKASLGAAIELDPEHISCYILKLEENTPLYARRNTLALPDDDMQADMYLRMVSLLKEAGYAQYEISNFAKPGKESRHNLKYWKLGEYIGLGPGAHSDFDGCRYSFSANLENYINGIKTGASLVDSFEQIPSRERQGEYLMLRLRTAEGIERTEYSRAFGREFDPLEALMKKYVQQGWAAFEKGRWHFTPEGFLISNQLIGELLEAQKEYKYDQPYQRRR
ncbi:MAG: radical SAM family heme chaperone HemW [Oscillospiraceae bacterium]|nr:radical SAM family heme chaperone HemW [Oscillospiraceae bacterium]